AKRGYEVTAVDMSDVAIERLRRAAASEGVLDRIEPALADAMDYDLEPQAYDLALCFRFFFPELAGKLASSLKHGGMLLCKVFTSEQLRYRPDWPADRVVAPGSLPGFFPELETIVHEESSRPEDAYAVLLARRPE
ncbi:MAG: class I SAM-dependent methyltransferase, partial [Myxococcota bacterium]